MTPKTFRVTPGIVGVTLRLTTSETPEVDGLREHGWEEGRDVVLEVRYAGPDPARFAELAAELGALKVDVIMTAPSEAVDVARRTAPAIPIVMTLVVWPRRRGKRCELRGRET